MTHSKIAAIGCLVAGALYFVLAYFDKENSQHHTTRGQSFVIGAMILNNIN